MPLPLVIAVQFLVAKPWGIGAATILAGFTIAVPAIAGISGVAGVLYAQSELPALVPSGVSAQEAFGFNAGLVVTAVAAAGFLLRPIRKDIGSFVPIKPDDPVHLMALVLTTILLGTQISAIAFTDLLAANNSQPPLGVVDLVENELPFLIAALFGVGIFIRRSLPASTARLGLVPPAWWHVALALAAAGVFFAFGQQADVLSHTLTPQLAHRVDVTTQHVFGQLNNPVGIAAIALLPGLCEEILFRGALQPRIGLIATAILFTSIHTEYGLSIDTLSVLVIALGLGLIRKYLNTTASATCHVSYNLLVGIGITGAALNAAIGLELVLVAATAYAIWTRRRATPVAP